MAYVSMKQMLETGVHFGHQTRRWNPKMRPFIFGARNGIHIIDLQQTVKLYRTAHDKIVETVANGGRVLFIGTKRQAQEAVAAEAGRAHQFYVTNRWMGGTLTNFVTIQKSIERLKKLEAMFADGSINRYQKKEVLLLQRELDKLEESLGGIKDMDSLPQLAFIIDPNREDIAVKECRKLGIPIVAVTDTATMTPSAPSSCSWALSPKPASKARPRPRIRLRKPRTPKRPCRRERPLRPKLPPLNKSAD